MRKHFLGYLFLGAYPDRNTFNVLAQIFALLTDLLLLFVVVRRNLIEIFLAVYLLDASKRFHVVI